MPNVQQALQVEAGRGTVGLDDHAALVYCDGMSRVRVYVETSVISYLVSRPSRDIVTAAHQEITRDWWDAKDTHTDVFVSELVLAEAGRGDPSIAAVRLAKLHELPLLSISQKASDLASLLLKGKLVPLGSEADALHIALATVHEMQFLVTWNFKHIANPHMRLAINRAMRDFGYASTVLCSPLELFEGEKK
jgi:predicted nucleic acid-binding protein